MRRRWTKAEEEYLTCNYGRVERSVLEKNLHRSWDAIKLKANKLSCCFYTTTTSHLNVKSDLKSLLDDTPLAFYWMGFLMADGNFSGRKRLNLTISKRDEQHLLKFSHFIKFPRIRIYGDMVCLAAQDSFIVPKICDKFDIAPRKTYNPPSFYNFSSADLFVSYFVGFIDGDGCIRQQYQRKDCCVYIKTHSSWIKFLQECSDLLSQILGVPQVSAKINKKGYAILNLTRQKTLRFLKEKLNELDLPVLGRKWNKIDTRLVSRQEIGQHRKEAVLTMKNKGMTINEIKDALGISYAGVYMICQRNGI